MIDGRYYRAFLEDYIVTKFCVYHEDFTFSVFRQN